MVTSKEHAARLRTIKMLSCMVAHPDADLAFDQIDGSREKIMQVINIIYSSTPITVSDVNEYVSANSDFFEVVRNKCGEYIFAYKGEIVDDAEWRKTTIPETNRTSH